MVILGIGGILGESACAVLKDGVLAGAIEERKLSRTYHAGGLPEQAIAFCLKQAKVNASQVDYVALARPLGEKSDVGLHLGLRERFPNSQLTLVDHHTAHAASAYYTSPFENASVLTLDRAGDFRCGALWKASGTGLSLQRDLYFPDSLGHLYGRVTSLLGFEPGADEHKVQWLSASGDGRFTNLFLEVLGSADGAWPRINRAFSDADRFSHGAFSERFYRQLGLAAGERIPEALRPHVASGLQLAIEQTAIAMAGSGENLCLGGGLAMNVLLVAAFERSGKWNQVYVQPAAGNSGTSIGAAAHVWHAVCRQSGRIRLDSLFLGPSFESEEIKQVLENCKLRFRYLPTTGELVQEAVQQISQNKIVAWMQGRAEFGPRALGNRSLLASPLDPYSTENLNTFVKHREGFRKFAASVPAELASEYFDVGPNARFLATVGRVKPAHRKTFESALLGSEMVRLHTVAESENPNFWRLLHTAGKATGLPVLYNTSFNLFGDPLACSPRDAVRSFYSSGVDAMFAGHFLLTK
ncbi:MAG: carbamoyltransferase [Candidatus Solibacter usitatus]|nr:carbamoyltransferase [Candidatus Solibacter usitatus]